MPTSTEDGAALPTAVASVTVAGRYQFKIVYPRDVSADSDPVADAYRRGDTAALTALVEVARTIVRPGDRVLDLGAHLGGFALAAAAIGCEVIAVEASADLAACLRQSVERNQLSNLVVVEAVVGDENGLVEFSSHGPFGHVATPRTGHPAKTVQATRVDSLLRERGWDTVKFVKLDVEGSEIRALKGMQSWLGRPDAPAVFFESNRHTLALYDQDDLALRAVFRQAGYLLYRVAAAGHLESVDEAHEQAEVCCDYLAIKPPLPSALRSWLPVRGQGNDVTEPPALIDWLGEEPSGPGALGGDPSRQSLSVFADWPSYLAALSRRPLPTVLILNTVPPPEAEPFLEWFGQRGVLLGATSALVRRLPPRTAWLAGTRLLLTDREPVRLTELPANACLYCLGSGALPSVPENCHVETLGGIEAALRQQQRRILSEHAAWEPKAPVTALGADAAAAAGAGAVSRIALPANEGSREKWLRRALRLVEIPVIGPVLSWGWAVRDLVGTRRKVLRFDERLAAVVEVQGNAGRDLRDLGHKLSGLEAARDRLQREFDQMAQRWSRELLGPGTAMPFALQRKLPDQLELARAGLDAQATPSPAELADPELSQMWLGELAGPEARAILARQYEAYWPWLEGTDGPVLDVGCGAGEWLAFLGARGKCVTGIDSNPHEVGRCRKADLDVHCADAFDWLKNHRGEYAAITLFQVIEHIPRERLPEFLALLASALRGDGLLVMETVNPAHPLALSIFYNDPTHQRPLPLEYLGFICQAAGLRTETAVYTYPVSVAVTGADWPATHYINYAVILRKP